MNFFEMAEKYQFELKDKLEKTYNSFEIATLEHGIFAHRKSWNGDRSLFNGCLIEVIYYVDKDSQKEKNITDRWFLVDVQNGFRFLFNKEKTLYELSSEDLLADDWEIVSL